MHYQEREEELNMIYVFDRKVTLLDECILSNTKTSAKNSQFISKQAVNQYNVDEDWNSSLPTSKNLQWINCIVIKKKVIQSEKIHNENKATMWRLINELINTAKHIDL